MSRIRVPFLALVVVMSALSPAAALAADPTPQGLSDPASADEVPVPLSRAQLRSVLARERQVAQVVASFPGSHRKPGTTESESLQAAAALCPTSAAAALEADTVAATAGTSNSPATTATQRIDAVAASSGCVSDFLAIYPRQQVKWFYCGPATVQQVINYTRGIFSWNQNVNAFSQQQISDWWLKTDANGGTSPYRERVGMNAGSIIPAGFIYMEHQVTSGADWHGHVITDITGWNMPLTAAVAPHDVGAAFWLTSWANRAVNTGHWIVIRGYYGKWDGTRNPLVYYTDSSGGLGGGTGRYYDPSFDVYQTLIKTNAVHTSGKWIVW